VKISDYKLVFSAVGLIGILLIASPAFAAVFHLPGGEQFSELYLLGPGHMAESIPFNIAVGQNYSVYLGVGNHMGDSVYYVCYVKLRNQTEPLPNGLTGTSSLITPLYEYRVCIRNEANWTSPLIFSFTNVSISNNHSLLESITINDVTFDVNKLAQFDQENNGYYYQLFVELWAFNTSSNALQYQNRYVYFWLNTTFTT
jgi:uncharacterized membrane protein